MGASRSRQSELQAHNNERRIRIQSGSYEVKLNQDSNDQMPTMNQNSYRQKAEVVDASPSLPQASDVLANLNWSFEDQN